MIVTTLKYSIIGLYLPQKVHATGQGATASLQHIVCNEQREVDHDGPCLRVNVPSSFDVRKNTPASPHGLSTLTMRAEYLHAQPTALLLCQSLEE